MEGGPFSKMCLNSLIFNAERGDRCSAVEPSAPLELLWAGPTARGENPDKIEGGECKKSTAPETIPDGKPAKFCV